MNITNQSSHLPPRNACTYCAALGAVLALKGIKGAVPLVQGSQACADFLSRQLMNHFQEPVELFSLAPSEDEGEILRTIDAIRRQFKPELIGIVSSCLNPGGAEKLSGMFDAQQTRRTKKKQPTILTLPFFSLPANYVTGFQATVVAVVKAFAVRGRRPAPHLNLFPGFVSPSDLRYLQEMLTDFRFRFVLLPDYSRTLDGPMWESYAQNPKGGTAISEIASMGSALASCEFGDILAEQNSAAKELQKRFDIPYYSIGLPVGARATDVFFEILQSLTGEAVPEKYQEERGRLIDAYTEAYKYVFNTRALVYGEENLVVGLASFLHEIGVIPAICASAGHSGFLQEKIECVIPDSSEEGIVVFEGVNAEDLLEPARELQADFFLGNSGLAQVAHTLQTPLLRVGFPIDDRMGGPRTLHLGYRGAQQLFDRIVNTMIEVRQHTSGGETSYY